MIRSVTEGVNLGLENGEERSKIREKHELRLGNEAAPGVLVSWISRSVLEEGFSRKDGN
jgi:hypothetical protein